MVRLFYNDLNRENVHTFFIERFVYIFVFVSRLSCTKSEESRSIRIARDPEKHDPLVINEQNKRARPLLHSFTPLRVTEACCCEVRSERSAPHSTVLVSWSEKKTDNSSERNEPKPKPKCRLVTAGNEHAPGKKRKKSYARYVHVRRLGCELFG